MPKDNDVPATKKDLQEMEKHIMNHFNLVVENLVHDFQGAHRDKIGVHEDALSDHEGRLIQLEKRAGILSA